MNILCLFLLFKKMLNTHTHIGLQNILHLNVIEKKYIETIIKIYTLPTTIKIIKNTNKTFSFFFLDINKLTNFCF